MYPLGLTTARSPAQSPLPGHLLATIGPAGHLAAMILLIASGLAIALSLVLRPPADALAATRRLALGLALMFALSPATRFGYFAYPLGLYGWIALCRDTTSDPVRDAERSGEADAPAGGAPDNARWRMPSGGRLACAARWIGPTGQRRAEGAPRPTAGRQPWV